MDVTENMLEALRYILGFSKHRLRDSDKKWQARQFLETLEQLIQGAGDRREPILLRRLVDMQEDRSGPWEVSILASYVVLVLTGVNSLPLENQNSLFAGIHTKAQQKQFFDPRVFEPLRDGLVRFFPQLNAAVTAPDVVVTATGPNPSKSLPLYLDPGGASPDDIRELLLALSDLHVAVGGTGLRFAIDGDRILVSEGVLV